jgi:hypothetical protein
MMRHHLKSIGPLGDHAPGHSFQKTRTNYIVLTYFFYAFTIKKMEIEFDTDKRDKTLRARGLDFARAGEIFADVIITIEDIRKNYGETRWMTVGAIDGRIVILIWTPRGAVRRIISMRYANEREITRYTQ